MNPFSNRILSGRQLNCRALLLGLFAFSFLLSDAATGLAQDEEAKKLVAVCSTTQIADFTKQIVCLLYTSPSPRDRQKSRMPSSA